MEDACKSNGDLAGSWLEEEEERAAPHSCILRIVSTVLQQNTFLIWDVLPLLHLWGAMGQGFQWNLEILSTVAKDNVLSCRKSIPMETREPSPIPNLTLTHSRVPPCQT